MYSVFIGSSSEGSSYAKQIAACLSSNGIMEPLGWWSQDAFSINRSFLESLFEILKQVDFAVFIATPDDILKMRGAKEPVVRNNVLLEYGLFAGHLGRMNALMVVIGDQTLPSDLSGIKMITVDRKVTRRSSLVRFFTRETWSWCPNDVADQITAHLLGSHCGFPILDLQLVRDPISANLLAGNVHIFDALHSQVFEKLKDYSDINVSNDHVRSAISSITFNETEKFGLLDKKTEVNPVIRPEALAEQDLGILSDLFCAHIARGLLEEVRLKRKITRLAIHRRGTKSSSLSLLSTVMRKFKLRPAIVEMSSSENSRTIGRFFEGEQCSFIQDITLTGNTPIKCVAELRRRKLLVKRLYSFIAFKAHMREIEANCAASNLEFIPFSLIEEDGNVVFCDHNPQQARCQPQFEV